MLSVLATLCLGGPTNLNALDSSTLRTSHSFEMAQPAGFPYLLAGPYQLNPGLKRPAAPPERSQQPSHRLHQRPVSPPIVPANSPVERSQGGAILSPGIKDVNPQPVDSETPEPSNTPASRPTAVPFHSPLLNISPVARPSGPAPLHSPRPSPPSLGVIQGGVVPPTDEPQRARPSGPSLPPTLQESPLPAPATDPEPDTSDNSAEQSVPRFRPLPEPTVPPDISPTSQPVLPQDQTSPDPKTAVEPPIEPPTVPADIPVQKTRSSIPPSSPTAIVPLGAADDPQVSFIVLESSKTDFKLDFDEFGKENLKIEEVVSFRIRNGDRATFTTGLNTYKQTDLEPVKNIPLILGWETELGDISVNVSAGAEVFNRLAPQPTFKVGAKTSVFGKVLVSGEVEQGPYKFNTTTLQNEISYWRLRPSVFWQIDSNTTLFGLFQAGFFSDGNQEIQSFSRLERKIGPFAVAANVFTWNFAKDLEAESGYFSPLSFLLYNAEIGWKGKIFDPLTCQFAASIGNQIVNGGKSSGRGLQTKCTASLAENVDLDFGYVLTNIISSGAGASNSHIFSGQLRIDF